MFPLTASSACAAFHVSHTAFQVVVVLHVDGVRIYLRTLATNGPTGHPQMIHEYGEPLWNNIGGEIRITRRKTCPSAT
jgi:hypothetical protein